MTTTGEIPRLALAKIEGSKRMGAYLLAYSSCARLPSTIVQGTLAETGVQAESRFDWTPAEAAVTTPDNVDAGSSYARISAGSNTRAARVIAVMATAAIPK